MRHWRSPGMGNGLTLSVRPDGRSLSCPQRGDVTLETCVACPLFVSAKTRRGKLSVCCRLSRSLAFGADLDAASRLSMTRAGASGRTWGY